MEGNGAGTRGPLNAALPPGASAELNKIWRACILPCSPWYELSFCPKLQQSTRMVCILANADASNEAPFLRLFRISTV